MVKEVELTFHNDFWDELGFRPDVDRVVAAAANAALVEAKATAHVDTGAYRDSISVHKTKSKRRVIYKLVATDWKAGILEARYGTLRKAGRKATRMTK